MKTETKKWSHRGPDWETQEVQCHFCQVEKVVHWSQSKMKQRAARKEKRPIPPSHYDLAWSKDKSIWGVSCHRREKTRMACCLGLGMKDGLGLKERAEAGESRENEQQTGDSWKTKALIPLETPDFWRPFCFLGGHVHNYSCGLPLDVFFLCVIFPIICI